MAKVTPEKKRPRAGAGEWRPAFLAALRNLPVARIACEAAGISRQTAYRWREQDTQFRERWDEALEEGVELIEATLMKRAMQTDTTAAIFLLKNLRPDKYKDRHEHAGPGGGAIPVTIYHLPDNARGDASPAAP